MVLPSTTRFLSYQRNASGFSVLGPSYAMGSMPRKNASLIANFLDSYPHRPGGSDGALLIIFIMSFFPVLSSETDNGRGAAENPPQLVPPRCRCNGSRRKEYGGDSQARLRGHAPGVDRLTT